MKTLTLCYGGVMDRAPALKLKGPKFESETFLQNGFQGTFALRITQPRP